jgi:hypothetical protein
MLAIAERCGRPKAERFYRPFRFRDGRLFLHHFPALRTGLPSLRPSGTTRLRRSLLERRDAGLGSSEDQGMNVLGSFIGIHREQVH